MRRAIVVSLLAIHAGLLAWQAYRYSPTIDEPAHLVAGMSHWKFGRFDLYRVNPPLVRLVAALPMLVVDPKTDWSAFTEDPYARPEFSIGTAFANANGYGTFWHFTLARWACIPFSLIGGWYCYRWASELYGKGPGVRGQGSGNAGQDSGFGIQDSGDERTPPLRKGGQGGSRGTSCDARSAPGAPGLDPRPSAAPGLMALTLWCFCPNVLGNGTLITPDVAAASLGVAAGYYFWRWLRAPTWLNAVAAGLSLGLAELTKSSWIVLFALWPALWIVWSFCRRKKGLGVGGQGSGSTLKDSGFRIRDSGEARTPPLSKGGPGGVVLDGDSRISPGVPELPLRSAAHCESSIPLSPHLTPHASSLKPAAAQLAFALLLALYLLNLGYGFEQSFERLGTFQFISKSLGGPEAHEKPGNRFAGSWLGALPVPFPANYLRGIDVQKYDFEKGKWSYLRGEQKMGGWWYYYLYAMGVKMPVGTLFLLALTCLVKVRGLRLEATDLRGEADRAAERQNDDAAEHKTDAAASPSSSEAAGTRSTIHNLRSSILTHRISILDEVVLLAPALVLIVLVSSQTGFNRYLRYVVPAFPFLYIWISQLAAQGSGIWGRGTGGRIRDSGLGIQGGALPPLGRGGGGGEG